MRSLKPWQLANSWTTEQDMPSGRFRIIAYSPKNGVDWSVSWQDTEQVSLASIIPNIVDILRSSKEKLQRLMTAEDEAEAEAEAERKAQALARHDPLTGLPNRRVFAAELEAALGHTRTEAAASSVLMIDLDRFKPVNDLQGHAVGDLVLCEVARRLREVVRKDDTVAGGGRPNPKHEMTLISVPRFGTRHAFCS